VAQGAVVATPVVISAIQYDLQLSPVLGVLQHDSNGEGTSTCLLLRKKLATTFSDELT
jgi:hypothetical protein